MSLLHAYLLKPNTQRVLSRKPGEKGFSLIELVVVVAVLAILSAIAIPAFTDISARAAHSAATNNLATVAKECAAKFANNESSATFGKIKGGNGVHLNWTASSATDFSCGLQSSPVAICAFVTAGTPATYCVDTAGEKLTGTLGTVAVRSVTSGSTTTTTALRTAWDPALPDGISAANPALW